MGIPLSIPEVSERLNKVRTHIYYEIRAGRLRVRMIFRNSILIDSDDLEEYERRYLGDNWMTVSEIALYFGLPHAYVRRVFRNYDLAGVQYRPFNSKTRVEYDIDSSLVKHIFKVNGWEQYGRLDGHYEGKLFKDEAERRSYARSGRGRGAAKRKSRTDEEDHG